MVALFTTERLTVRRFSPDDYEDLADILADPEVTFFEPYQTFTREACVGEAAKLAESEEFFAVVLGDTVIGKIYFSRKGAGTYEIGYAFSVAYQGQGYASESVRAFFDYAFTQLGARRIVAQIDTRNVKSVNLAERVGMRREALHRELFPRKEDKDTFSDFYIYALLKNDLEEEL
jgi:RimJ/RimL family protein N-acetyltransferase